MFLPLLLATCLAAPSVPPLNFPETQTITHSRRKLTNITVAANGGTAQPFYYWGKRVYNDRTCRPAAMVPVGADVDVRFNYNDVWMHGYVYIDLNGDEEFTVLIDEDGQMQEGNECVAFSYYNTFDSNGQTYTDGGENELQPPTFRLPEDLEPGFYRMRTKVDWNNLDPAGSTEAGEDIVKNGGAIYDLRLRVYDPSQPISYTCIQPAQGGSLRIGTSASGTAAFGTALRLSASRSNGYELDHVIVRHGNLAATDSLLNGVAQWSVDTLDASFFTGGTTMQLPAYMADGDIEITGCFLPTAEREYVLVFEDEFEDDKIDDTKWVWGVRQRATWNRWIAQTPQEKALTAWTEDGNLVLRAIANPYQDEDPVEMVTGALWTGGKHDFLYGYAEARLKTINHTGNFPAFWMMPTDQRDGWPACGEIDIWETIDNSNVAYFTLHHHWGNTLGQSNNPSKAFSRGCRVEEYHRYGIEWTPAYMRWYLDGVQVGEYKKTLNDVSIWQERGQWPYDKAFYLIINQSVGNNAWAANADVDFDYRTTVDYIRFYQRRSSPFCTAISPSETVSYTAPSEGGPATVYDLQGRRVQQPVKGGIYIVNGKKVIK